jgi:cell division protein FtsB
MGPSEADFRTLVARELQALRACIEALEAQVANLKAAAAAPTAQPRSEARPFGRA